MDLDDCVFTAIDDNGVLAKLMVHSLDLEANLQIFKDTGYGWGVQS